MGNNVASKTSRLSFLRGFASKWYVASILLGALGIILGSMVFFFAWPGKPKIGVIDIPCTIINDRSAHEIRALIDYTRDHDSIKGVVIHLNTPGGGSAPSEHLYMELVRLREKKPVIMVMNDVVASGGYMIALGTNFIFAQPSSYIAGVGVILSPLPRLVPRQPNERTVMTGPFKGEGGDRRHFLAVADQLKQAFGQMVLAERGDRLKISLEELMEGKIYPGVEGVRLGLVDAVGGNTDAIEKAAALANVSGFDVIDINTEVSIILNKKLQRINEPLQQAGLIPLQAQHSLLAGDPYEPQEASGFEQLTGVAEVDALRLLPLPGGIGEDPETALPDFPLRINGPNVYYLYVGPSP